MAQVKDEEAIVKRNAWHKRFRSKGPQFSRSRLLEALEEAQRRDPSMTKGFIAAQCGISTPTLYNYLREKRKNGMDAPEPTAGTLARLAEATGKPMEFFFV